MKLRFPRKVFSYICSLLLIIKAFGWNATNLSFKTIVHSIILVHFCEVPIIEVASSVHDPNVELNDPNLTKINHLIQDQYEFPRLLFICFLSCLRLHSGLNTAEVLDLWVGAWRLIAPMSCRRSSVGAGALDGKIYAVGGYDGVARRCLSSVECYDPVTNSWAPVADLTCR